nr:glycoside hydrolase family 68 protein [Streptococcus marmotae]
MNVKADTEPASNLTDSENIQAPSESVEKSKTGVAETTASTTEKDTAEVSNNNNNNALEEATKEETGQGQPTDEAAQKEEKAAEVSSRLNSPALPINPTTGLTSDAEKIASEAQIDIATLTEKQKEALNKIVLVDTAESGNRMTYKQFEDIANALVEQDPKYAIPYFNAEVIKNMPAATTKDAQTGEVADLDVWDSWPVQDIRTGHVSNWNGYQLVVAMMGVPNTNDNHLYLLYNQYGDNNFDNWKNAGSIFGYTQTPAIQQWSGSAVVNSDNSIQLYYTHVDTTDQNSNNQQLATATLNLVLENGEVKIKSVENDRVLTPEGGDGYFYQSYKQWRKTFTGADNIAMRDPHVIEDTDGSRYLIFEASTGEQDYQGEHQIYRWSNYGGDAKYNVKSLFRLLENADMYDRASWANAAIGILKLTGDEKTPEIERYYTPLVSSPMVSDEIERPNVVRLGDKYYLFAASRLNHGSNNDAWVNANYNVGDNVVMLGYVSDSLTKGYKPLNMSGVVLTASVPADWRTATYSYYAVPVEGSSDTLLVTSYMTNRNEVAGKGKNSTWAPSFLIQILPDNTTRVLAKMTQQGDWIWDEGSETQITVGTRDTAHLPGEDDGYIDWNVIGGYNLKHHTAHVPTRTTPTPTPTPYRPTPSTPRVTPEVPVREVPKAPVATPAVLKPVTPTPVSSGESKLLPKTGVASEQSGFVYMATALGLAGLAMLPKRKEERE